MEELYGKEVSDILASIERHDLEYELERIKNSKFPEDSRLFLELKKRNPDDAMTAIAYVKGAFFLKTLEQKVGRQRFDKFLNSYFKNFAFKTVNSKMFVGYLEKNLLKPNQIKFNYQEWIYEQGLPTNCIKINSGRLNRMKDFALNYSKGIDVFAPKIKYRFVKIKGKKKRKKFIEQIKRNDFIVQEWQTFIHSLPENIGKSKLQKLDSYFSFKNCGNTEIMTDWFVLGIKNNYTELNPDIQKFLVKVGRRKYLLPIYETMLNNNKTKALAIDIFEKNKGNYHSVTKNSIEELINN